ncbi:Endoribonuclease L-PSP/chorismate mutase-like protein [Aspergillus varians]
MPPPIVTTLNRPDTSPAAPTFSDLSVVPIPPLNPTTHLLQTAGQVGTPRPTTPPTPLPTSLQAQAQNAFANVAACLHLKGATPRDITKITIFVVDLVPEMRSVLVDVIQEFFRAEDGAESHKPPSSLVGVARLASSEFLIEVEATAVVAV